MNSLDLRVTIAAPVELIYEVVADVERYPQFLSDVSAVDRKDDLVGMTVHAGPFPMRLVTRARFDPPRAIDLEQVEGPFRRFSGRWTFTPTSNGSTEVAYRADYEMPLLGALLGGATHALLERQTQRQIAGFEARVRELAAQRRKD